MLRKKKKRKAIETQVVYVKNNQVFLKKSNVNTNSSEEWSPILFHWSTV